MDSVSETLAERGKRYGTFNQQAQIQRRLHSAIIDSYGQIGKVLEHELSEDQRAALDMIVVKIARIINGDPNYSDSWHDIAGYAELVADRLDGIEQ